MSVQDYSLTSQQQANMWNSVNTIRTFLAKLLPQDQGFAKGLCDQYSRKMTSMSEKQLYWIVRLHARIEGREKEFMSGRHDNRPKYDQAVEAQPKPSVDLSPIIQLLSKAATSLKYPKIRVSHEGHDFVLALAGDRSKYKGCVNVMSTGSFNDRDWYGRINLNGSYQSSLLGDKYAEPIVNMLDTLAKDPAGYAKMYGQRYNHCCFCGKELIERHSVAAGFGPICAEKYGLTAEWESAVERAEKDVVAA